MEIIGVTIGDTVKVSFTTNFPLTNLPVVTIAGDNVDSVSVTGSENTYEANTYHR